MSADRPVVLSPGPVQYLMVFVCMHPNAGHTYSTRSSKIRYAGFTVAGARTIFELLSFERCVMREHANYDLFPSIANE
jgi:hypothetical protein